MRKLAPGNSGFRLREVRKALGLTQAAFANTVGVSQDTISRVERTGSIEPVALIAICCVHGVSRAWLERGEGAMFAGAEPEEGDYTPVPLANVRLAAGHGAEVYSEGELDHLQFRTAWLRGELRASVRNLVAMYVEGESMRPTLGEGDVVLVDRSRTDPTREGVYALRQDNALLIKRVRMEGRTVLLVSDNPEYPPTVFPWPAPIHRAQVIGRVVWAGKRF